jgi:hypothetical protein
VPTCQWCIYILIRRLVVSFCKWIEQNMLTSSAWKHHKCTFDIFVIHI